MAASILDISERQTATMSYITVDFPKYRRMESDSSPGCGSQTEDTLIRITIEQHNPYSSRCESVDVPIDTHALERSIATVYHAHGDLDLNVLVKELIELGCARPGRGFVQTPHTLPSGGDLNDCYHHKGLEQTIQTLFLSATDGEAKEAVGCMDELMLMHGRTGSRVHVEKSYILSDSDPSATSSPVEEAFGYIISDACSSRSTSATPLSFESEQSPASYTTARSAYASPILSLDPLATVENRRGGAPSDPSLAGPLQKLRDDYYNLLYRENIVQPFYKELNWSGKGQHVTFLSRETIPLTVLSHLGASVTAKVDKVLCRRIALARKTMRCSRQWSVADALREVYHLQNLRHFHIVQLVGSYLQGRDFTILMYPVADCHLGTFLEDTADMHAPDISDHGEPYKRRIDFLSLSLGCLTSAIAYIHEKTTKHMDIKPQNILVRKEYRDRPEWRVYLADFGLSRSFAAQEYSQTDGPTPRTPRYCAPEVYQYERRGRSADIFSMGCVFAEIMTVLAGRHPQDFADFRRGDDSDESFHANLPKVGEWLDIISLAKFSCLKRWDMETTGCSVSDSNGTNVVKKMIANEPEARPTARTLQSGLCMKSSYNIFRPRYCCGLPPEQFAAHESSTKSAQYTAGDTANSPVYFVD
jgi:serine/threonine protein kinase